MPRTLCALLLTAGLTAAQEPTQAQPGPTPATTQPMPVTTPGVVQGGYVMPATPYPYQPGRVVQMGYAQPGVMSAAPAVYGYTYAPVSSYPSYGYAYPSFANGYANSTLYGTAGGGRRWFRR